MEMFRKTTWIELKVPPPAVGMVFVHAARPDRPLMITDILEDEIQRVDVCGVTAPWGSIDDWRDEYRRRAIKVVYEPKKNDLDF